jgi:hypothetical protein
MITLRQFGDTLMTTKRTQTFGAMRDNTGVCALGVVLVEYNMQVLTDFQNRIGHYTTWLIMFLNDIARMPFPEIGALILDGTIQENMGDREATLVANRYGYTRPVMMTLDMTKVNDLGVPGYYLKSPKYTKAPVESKQGSLSNNPCKMLLSKSIPWNYLLGMTKQLTAVAPEPVEESVDEPVTAEAEVIIDLLLNDSSPAQIEAVELVEV